MKKFLKIVAALLFTYVIYKGSVIAITYLALADAVDNEYYSASKRDSAKPNVFFVGSSNLDFNIDYDRLKTKFSGYNFIGCNYSASSGQFLILQKLKELGPTKKDVIIIASPHGHYEMNNFLPMDDPRVLIKLSNDRMRQAFKFNALLTLRSWLKISPLDLPLIFKQSNKAKNRKKTNEVINSYIQVDHTAANYKNCKPLENDRFKVVSLGLDEFYIDQSAKSMKDFFPGKVYYWFPPIHEGLYEIDTNRINKLNESEDHLFLNSFNESIYPKEYWFNQWYHLNQCGRDKNTALLIEKLENKGILK